jgi:lipopolysaccharide export system permease protein
MRLLDRYLLRELLLPLGFCLGGFLIFWIAFDLFGEVGDLQRSKLHGLDIAQLYLVRSPEFLVTILPVALLLALLYALTQHARHHEITAIRSAGVSLWRLCAPYLVVGLFLSGVALALNELVAPGSAELAEEIKTRRARPAGEARAGRQIRNFAFDNGSEGRRWFASVYNLENGDCAGLEVTWTKGDGLQRKLFAERGYYTNSSWAFVNVKEYRQVSITNSILAPLVFTNFMEKAEFRETPEQIRSEVKIAGSLGLGSRKRVELPVADLLDYLRLHPRLTPPDRAWLLTKLHGRLAAPWTCFVVVLIAIPFGTPSGRRNIFVGVASSIFICFAYFVLLTLGLALGTGGYLPPWFAAWLPNIVFGGAAIYLISRVR